MHYVPPGSKLTQGSVIKVDWLAYTLYKKPPDPGLSLELCRHCACLFHVLIFVQVRGKQEVGYSAVLDYICRSHLKDAPLLDMTTFRSGGFMQCVITHN